jgi:hypothetical protein
MRSKMSYDKLTNSEFPSSSEKRKAARKSSGEPSGSDPQSEGVVERSKEQAV